MEQVLRTRQKTREVSQKDKRGDDMALRKSTVKEKNRIKARLRVGFRRY